MLLHTLEGLLDFDRFSCKSLSGSRHVAVVSFLDPLLLGLGILHLFAESFCMLPSLLVCHLFLDRLAMYFPPVGPTAVM